MQPRSATIERFRRDLKARNLRPNSIDAYVRCVRQFVEQLDRPPSRVRESNVRDYVVELQTRRAPRSVNQAIAALRCFYVDTLHRPNVVARLRRVRVSRTLPTILSGSEVQRLLAAAKSAKYRAILLLLYGVGLRVGEACALRIQDIDSKRMMLRIPRSKTRTRDVPLSPTVLRGLRDCWRAERPAGPWLFPGPRTGRPLTRCAVKNALDAIQQSVALSKHVTPHDLRHAYATHLLDTGADVRSVQVLLGHASLKTTLHYTRSSRARLTAYPSPIELLGTPAGRVLG